MRNSVPPPGIHWPEFRFSEDDSSREEIALTVIASESSNMPLTLRLFGPMQVLIHGRPLPHLRSRKALWLLALLTLRQDRPVLREWLAGTLWPDTDQSRAFTSLRATLSELRGAFGDQSERL